MKIGIVEDNTLLRENLAFLINGEPDLEVCCSYGSAEELDSSFNLTGAEDSLVDRPDNLPDILLLDLGLPGMSGIELTKKIKAGYPEIDIMVHTVFDNRDTVFAAIKAGASGYILKGAAPRELIGAIHNLSQGGAPMSPKIARAVISEFQEGTNDDPYLLTAREKEILGGLQQGLTYKELGDKLCISPHTIHSHIKNIYEKLHAKNRKEALTKARQKGII